MVEEIILQHWIFTRFAYPFLLIFFLIFAILEKTKLLGENKQINALVAFVIGFIFISVAYPTEVASDLILFLTVAIVVMFVALLLWGFIMGKEGLDVFGKASKGLKWVMGIVIVVAVGIATIWATGVQGNFIDTLFRQSWSKTLWTNVIFIALIAVALAVVVRNSK